MLSLSSFHHISREISSLNESKTFYLRVLGFEEIPRPAINCVGAWLIHRAAGLHLHLIEARDAQTRSKLVKDRTDYQWAHMPFVDHMAFVVEDLPACEKVLLREGLKFLRNTSVFGAIQLFFADPDGNVIELASCAPPVGEINCVGSETRGLAAT